MEDILTTTVAPESADIGMHRLNDVLSKKLSLDEIPTPQDWAGWFSLVFLKWAVFATEDPWGFVSYVFMLVCPLLIVSGVCSWKLAQLIEKEEAEKKQKARRESNLSKTRRHAKAE